MTRRTRHQVVDSRYNNSGSVWLWGESGRPVAILELYQRAQTPGNWFFLVVNLSGGTLRAFQDDTVWWQEDESAVEMNAFLVRRLPIAEPYWLWYASFPVEADPGVAKGPPSQ